MADIVSRIYSNFRGVDFRGEDVNLTRSPDSLNMWKDYKKGTSIRTRPGLSFYGEYGTTVNGIYFYKDDVIIHSGNYILSDKKGWMKEIAVQDKPSQGFVYDENLYLLDGVAYYRYDGDIWTVVDGYVPTTSISRSPSGGGKTHEDVNMLSESRKNSFVADGEQKEYKLDTTNIDGGVIVTFTDQAAISYSVDTLRGIVAFETAPQKPQTDGQDNVIIQFDKTIERHKEMIQRCTIAQVFDNRVFFSGNPKYPNMMWHSSLDDPTYVSDLDYYQEGRDEAPVRGMVAGNNALWVFREPSDEQTTVFYHVPTLDADYGKIYPSTHSSISTGCVGKAINFNDDIVFFSDRGMEGISGDITTEQLVAHRSSLVDRKLTAEEGYKDMILAEWEGYLLVFIGNKVYLADSRGAFTNENHTEYEWFYWELNKNVTCAVVHDGILYVGDEIGDVFVLEEDSELGLYEQSYWVTAKDKFNNPHKLKTTNKRGCVAEATGDISVYAKLEDTDFELIGNYKNVTDYFVSRIKRKKFKDIQLKFYSDTGFSLESVTLEAFVGGYIKR